MENYKFEISQDELINLLVALKSEIVKLEEESKKYIKYREEELDEEIKISNSDIIFTPRELKEELEKRLEDIKSLYMKMNPIKKTKKETS
ncbi:MAG: hypothetical protein MJA82_10920 [Clostridia bacterium]|nr:hypothetical protein [Clostridia bacterium]